MNHTALKLDRWQLRQRLGFGANAGEYIAAMARCGPPERRSAWSTCAATPRRQRHTFGYRYLSIDYQSGAKEINMQMFGPFTALVFRF